MADCLEGLEELLHLQGGGTAFGPALECAHRVIAETLQHAEYSPLLMFMSDGCCGTSDGEPEMVTVRIFLLFVFLLLKVFTFLFQSNGFACSSQLNFSV